jgi:hypothetical protein
MGISNEPSRQSNDGLLGRLRTAEDDNDNRDRDIANVRVKFSESSNELLEDKMIQMLTT